MPTTLHHICKRHFKAKPQRQNRFKCGQYKYHYKGADWNEVKEQANNNINTLELSFDKNLYNTSGYVPSISSNPVETKLVKHNNKFNDIIFIPKISEWSLINT